MKKIFSILFILPFLLGCNPNEEEQEFPEHSYEEIINLKIDWSNAIDVSGNDHLVYYYSETCFYCEEIRNEVIDFAINEYYEIYFVEANAHVPHTYDYTKINQTIFSNRAEDIYVGVTPQLALISNGRIKENVLDKIYIEELLDRYK